MLYWTPTMFLCHLCAFILCLHTNSWFPQLQAAVNHTCSLPIELDYLFIFSVEKKQLNLSSLLTPTQQSSQNGDPYTGPKLQYFDLEKGITLMLLCRRCIKVICTTITKIVKLVCFCADSVLTAILLPWDQCILLLE